MHTRSGTFRRFAFIGYSDTFSAQESIKYFNNTYIGTSKIQVIEAKSFGDSSIPRPWSRYSHGSSTNQIYEKKRKPTKGPSIEEEGQKEEEERKSKRLKLNEDVHQSQLASLVNELEELKSEPGFMEFLAANKHGRSMEVWSNEGKGNSKPDDEKKKKRKEEETDEDNNCK